MKAISILQPWATLVASGFKHFETRSWNIKYRGELLIHASAKWNNSLYQKIIDIGAEEPLYSIGYHLTSIKNGTIKTNLPLGAIIGKVNLIDCIKVSDLQLMKDTCTPMRAGGKLVPENWDREFAFGDYSFGRYGWLLSEPVLFKTPIPYKGQLQIWNYNGEIPESAD